MYKTRSPCRFTGPSKHSHAEIIKMPAWYLTAAFSENPSNCIDKLFQTGGSKAPILRPGPKQCTNNKPKVIDHQGHSLIKACLARGCESFGRIDRAGKSGPLSPPTLVNLGT
ncbi:predicted protein [Aspergillus nidulans FGSC A4]|uniref:Uncharacterized protein n=1 Tax=Emericella nidulans (strain FGSC A4 / ATCC 38163 / CBS 112.46 / NRRL 194 / M139) TaxID=227321 RepID=Q5BFN5_EMENI|nr:hypothetical protein [Aspergillus nidulans FGSC A4]EAA65150.1 predicted protein [Aspergillus nidulans FGSC A4]CBF89069.1 TPA: hypothetical protein ANIA_00645 [Aspergillus nidulans FGSC A4]|eukprot:XP_658249.1 predicted protein [Aspergillus nidulans FGSC A4]